MCKSRTGLKLSAHSFLISFFAAILSFGFSVPVIAQTTVTPTSVAFSNVVMNQSSAAQTQAIFNADNAGMCH